MTISVVCGVNWGDEGKGRMVDLLSGSADFVVRYQGGNNAGHTVVNEFGTFKLHLIPSGIFREDVTNVLGQGTVVDIQALVDEIDSLGKAGISTASLRVSDRATLCLPFHRMEDEWEEERLAHRAYGSTKRGIAPAYGDRMLKKAIQIGTLFEKDALRQNLEGLVEWKSKVAEGVYRKSFSWTIDDLMDWCNNYGNRIRDFVTDTTELLRNANLSGARILCEAQLGALRDVYFGIYPYTSSSCSLAAFAPIGSGLFGHHVNRVVGVMKSFSTCVGEGPFVTEMPIEDAANLREVALEYGAATGRPRRIGHFDAVASRYGIYLQGATEVALTKLDSLSGRSTLKICVAYEEAGRKVDGFPLVPRLSRCRPVYEEHKGWEEDIQHCRVFDQLPKAAQAYVERIESLIECRIPYVSVGPERDQLICR